MCSRFSASYILLSIVLIKYRGNISIFIFGGSEMLNVSCVHILNCACIIKFLARFRALLVLFLVIFHLNTGVLNTTRKNQTYHGIYFVKDHF